MTFCLFSTFVFLLSTFQHFKDFFGHHFFIFSDRFGLIGPLENPQLPDPTDPTAQWGEDFQDIPNPDSGVVLVDMSMEVAVEEKC
jgi:hypothetical protein